MQNHSEKTIREVTALETLSIDGRIILKLWCWYGHTELLWASYTVIINIFYENQEFRNSRGSKLVYLPRPDPQSNSALNSLVWRVSLLEKCQRERVSLNIRSME